MKSVVFVFDSLRAAQISHLGYHRNTTPNIDSIAADGVTFEQAFSQAMWTGPSSGSIVASQYPLVHRTGFMYRRRESPPSIAQPFQDSEHITACISPMRALGSDRYDGFDEHVDLFETCDPGGKDTPQKLIQHTLEFIDDHHDEDFFLFVWTSGTHTPYVTPDKYEPRFSDGHGEEEASIPALQEASYEKRETVQNHYDDAIRYSDAEFGRVLDCLREHGIYDEATITVTADHGELLDEHYRLEQVGGRIGRTLKAILPSTIKSKYQLFERTGWVGHQAVLPYDELIHVPLVMKLPENEHAGRRVTRLAQTLDIGPTLHDYAGLGQMNTAQGMSLRPAIDHGNIVNKYVYSSSPMLMGLPIFHSIRDEAHKYIRIDRKPMSDQVRAEFRSQPMQFLFSILMYSALPNEVLFDVDAGEMKDISYNRPDLLEQFRDEYENWYDTGVGDQDDVITDGKMEHLESLGYID